MGTSTIPGGSHTRSDTRLRRSLSVWQLYFIMCSALIGSGWLFASLGAASTAGPSAIVSWIIASILIVIIALSFSEMAGILPRTGAAVRYPHFTHGGFVGGIIGWCYLLWALAVPSLEAEAVVTYASDYLPGLIRVTGGANVLTATGIGFAVVLMIVFAVINYFGVLLVGRLSTYITLWKMIVPALTFIFLFAFNMHAGNYLSYGGFTPTGNASILSTIVTSGITFSLIAPLAGIEFGGESRNPQRDVPVATIAAMLTAAIIYILLQASFIGAINWHAMGVHPGDWAGLKTGSWSGAPFAKALQSSSVGFVGAYSIVLLIDAYVSPGATGFVYQGIGARTVYGLSTMAYLPDVFQRLNRHRIPWVGLLLAFIVGCFLFAPFPSWYSIVSVASSTIAVVLVMSGIGLRVLRRTAPDLPRLYRLFLAPVMAPAATASAVILVYWAGYATLVVVVSAALFVLPAWSALFAPAKGWMNQGVGIVLGALYLAAWIAIQVWGGWFLAPATRPLSDHPPFGLFMGAMAVTVAAFMVLCHFLSTARGRTEIWRSAWLPFFILGVVPISFYGAYGPLPKPWLPYPLDTLTAIVLGLIVYYWGSASGFLTELVQEVNERGTGVVTDADEDELAARVATGQAPTPGGAGGA